MFFLFMSKANVNMINGLYVDMKGLNRIKEMSITDRKTKIVFMPVSKSYADTFALHYINYISDMEFGFTFGYYQDSP